MMNIKIPQNTDWSLIFFRSTQVIMIVSMIILACRS